MKHVCRLLVLDQEPGSPLLAVHGVQSDRPSAQVQRFQQFPDLGDLVGLVRDVPLGHHEPGAVDHRGQQVHGPAVGLPRAACGFPVYAQRACQRLLRRLAFFRLVIVPGTGLPAAGDIG